MKYKSLTTIAVFYLGWILFSFALQQLNAWIPPVLALAAEYLCILSALLVCSALTLFYRQRFEPYLESRQPYRVGALLVGLLICLGVYFLVSTHGFRSDLITAFYTANLLFMACLLGHWLVLPLKRPAELVPLCLVVALVDIYSVFRGPTKSMTVNLADFYSGGQVGSPPVIDYLLVKFPIAGQPGLAPVFGISDWVIIAMLSAAAAKFGMRDNLFGSKSGPFVSLAAIGLLISIVCARIIGFYLPALPLIALIFLAVMIIRYPQVRQLTHNELKPLGVLCALLVGAMLIMRF